MDIHIHGNPGIHPAARRTRFGTYRPRPMTWLNLAETNTWLI